MHIHEQMFSIRVQVEKHKHQRDRRQFHKFHDIFDHVWHEGFQKIMKIFNFCTNIIDVVEQLPNGSTMFFQKMTQSNFSEQQ